MVAGGTSAAVCRFPEVTFCPLAAMKDNAAFAQDQIRRGKTGCALHPSSDSA